MCTVSAARVEIMRTWLTQQDGLPPLRAQVQCHLQKPSLLEASAGPPRPRQRDPVGRGQTISSLCTYSVTVLVAKSCLRMSP